MASVIESVATAAATVPHPYSPTDALIPEYRANTLSTPEILVLFCGALSVVLVPAFQIIRRKRPDLSNLEFGIAMWFVLCAAIHTVLEGYFAFNFRDISAHSSLLGQMWKEYSLSDSRYLTQDTFISCMEAVTAIFWGPLSLAIAACIVADHPLRHPFQLIVSLGQLYGDVLYFATCTFSEKVYSLVYCRPELVYFYAYYIFLNAIWIVIPSLLIVQSVRAMVRAFEVAKAAEKKVSFQKNK